MTICSECKNFFATEDDPLKGNCVQRVVDPRQSYYKSAPVNAGDDSSKCEAFLKK